MTPAWTNDRIATLTEAWLAGASAAQIARHLGDGVTKSAVLGKVRRLGLCERGGTRRQEPAEPTTGAARSAPPAGGGPQLLVVGGREAGASSVSPAGTDRLAVVRLEGARCAWPIGDLRSPDFRFCEATPVAGRPYCGEHCRRAGLSAEPKPMRVMGRVARPYRVSRGEL